MADNRIAKGTGGKIMAEYVEVCRQHDRMCAQFEECFDCPLHKNFVRCTKKMGVVNYIRENAEKAEKVIMEWAAENPKPIYPSVAEYLEQFGIIIRRDGMLQADFFKAHEPMSADIAQKLGIDPKLPELPKEE